MKKEEALNVICMVAEGLDPYIENDSFKNLPEINPVTVRALCTAIASLLSEKDRKKLASKYKRRRSGEYSDLTSGPLKSFLEESEKREILLALEESNYNEADTAKILGMRLFELNKKIRPLCLDAGSIAQNFLNNSLELTLNQLLKKIESQIIIEALSRSHYNIKKAADLLCISSRSLSHRLKKHNIDINHEISKTNYFDIFSGLRSLDTFIKDIEREVIIETLKSTKFNLNRAADLIGISFQTLLSKIRALRIKI